MATELDKIFSGNKKCQLWIKVQRFGDHLRLHHQGNYSPDDRDGKDFIKIIMYAFLTSTTRATCPAHLMLLESLSGIELRQNKHKSAYDLRVDVDRPVGRSDRGL
jgi:hypothetical protein